MCKIISKKTEFNFINRVQKMFGLNKFKSTGQFVLIVFMISTIIVCADCCTSRIEFFTDIVEDTIKNNKGVINHYQSDLKGYNRPQEEPEEPPDKSNQNRKMNEHDRILLESVRSECSTDFEEMYCLNGGRCFNYTFDDENFLPSCECYGEFQGERCEDKFTINSGIYGIHQKTISLAKVCIGSFLAGIIGSLIIYLICLAITNYHF